MVVFLCSVKSFLMQNKKLNYKLRKIKGILLKIIILSVRNLFGKQPLKPDLSGR